jgi:hypothetical protein
MKLSPVANKPSFNHVLSVLQSFYSDRCRSTSQEELDIDLGPNVPISEILKLNDGDEVFFFLKHFGVPVPKEHHMSSIVTIGDFCHYVIDSIELPSIQSCPFFDQQCDSAGLFLSIKKQLVARGESECEIGPSTKLLPYVKRHHDYFSMLRWFHTKSMPYPYRWHILTSVGCIAYLSFLTSSAMAMFFCRLDSTADFILKYTMVVSPVILLLLLFLSEKVLRNRFIYVNYGDLSDFRSLVNFILSRPRQSIA